MKATVLYGPRDIRFEERNTAMTHLAVAEALNGKVVDRMEKVTDEQYRRAT